MRWLHEPNRTSGTLALSLTLTLAAAGASGCEACSSTSDAQSPARLEVRVRVDGPSRPISPYVYGINGTRHLDAEPGVFTLLRFGGNRTTTYNWENNASNAGHDPPRNQNDGHLSRSDEPGAAVTALLDAAQQSGAAALVTVPMIGRVAADRRADGDVTRDPSYLERRFVRSVPRCSEDAPRLDDGVVCQHAFVRFVRDAAADRGVRVFFALDNEPSSWPVTHPALREDRPLTYAELVRRSVAYASMLQEEAPDAAIFGPATFGWPAMTRLAGAPDAEDRDFLDHYLSSLRRASRGSAGRLLDVLDIHWYPDVHLDGRKVRGPDDDPARARLRMQLPRSLYDDGYVEPSWISRDWLDGEPVRLLPRVRTRIREHYPGTKLAVTEWGYGGGAHPSGAVAAADVLGAFGRHGVFAATYWPLTDQTHEYALAAFRMYRRVDGETSFGDRSIEARSTDPSRVSAWASLDSQHPGRVVVVLIHRGDRAATVPVVLEGGAEAPRARAFVLDAEASEPRPASAPAFQGGRSSVSLPPRSVTTLVLSPPDEPEPARGGGGGGRDLGARRTPSPDTPPAGGIRLLRPLVEGAPASPPPGENEARCVALAQLGPA